MLVGYHRSENLRLTLLLFAPLLCDVSYWIPSWRMHICLQMHRFVVHGCLVRKNRNSPWRLVSYLFGHRELTACQEWSTRIMDSLGKQVGRPRNLLVHVLLVICLHIFLNRITFFDLFDHSMLGLCKFI